MKTCVDVFLVLTVLVQLTIATSVQQLTPSPTQKQLADWNAEGWKRFLSLDGRFSVLLPAPPISSDQTIKRADSEFVLHQFSVQSLPEYHVSYADYPTALIETLSVDEFFDKAAAEGRTSPSSKWSNTNASHDGYPAQLRKRVSDDGTIVRNKMILVGQRMYQLLVAAPAGTALDPEKNRSYEEIANKFLDSFRLVTPGAIKGEFRTIQRAGTILYEACLPGDLNCPLKPGPTLNGRAIKLPKPEMPAIARAAHAEGIVEVEVIVDEKGDVIGAQAVKGHPLLVSVSLEAARKAKFTPTLIGNKPVKVIAVVIYHFRDR